MVNAWKGCWGWCTLPDRGRTVRRQYGADAGGAARPGGGWMAAERLTMRKTREILRQKWELGLSHRQVARSLGIGLGTVSETLTRAIVAKLDSWAAVQAVDDAMLEE